VPGVDPDPVGAEWLRLRRAMEEARLESGRRADAERIWRARGLAAALEYVRVMKELEAGAEDDRG